MHPTASGTEKHYSLRWLNAIFAWGIPARPLFRIVKLPEISASIPEKCLAKSRTRRINLDTSANAWQAFWKRTRTRFDLFTFGIEWEDYLCAYLHIKLSLNRNDRCFFSLMWFCSFRAVSPSSFPSLQTCAELLNHRTAAHTARSPHWQNRINKLNCVCFVNGLRPPELIRSPVPGTRKFIFNMSWPIIITFPFRMDGEQCRVQVFKMNFLAAESKQSQFSSNLFANYVFAIDEKRFGYVDSGHVKENKYRIGRFGSMRSTMRAWSNVCATNRPSACAFESILLYTVPWPPVADACINHIIFFRIILPNGFTRQCDFVWVFFFLFSLLRTQLAVVKRLWLSADYAHYWIAFHVVHRSLLGTKLIRCFASYVSINTNNYVWRSVDSGTANISVQRPRMNGCVGQILKETTDGQMSGI